MTEKSPDQQEGQKIAVALKHDMRTPEAPKVIASGKGKLAEQILEIAFQNGVKVREDKDLAQILSVVEVDCEIPLEAFTAVAEILAYVYAANRKMMEQSSHG